MAYLSSDPGDPGALLDLLLLQIELGEPQFQFEVILRHRETARMACSMFRAELIDLAGFACFRLELGDQLEQLADLADADPDTTELARYLRSLGRTLAYTRACRRGEEMRPPVEDGDDWQCPGLDCERPLEMAPTALMSLHRQYAWDARSDLANEVLTQVLEIAPRHYPAWILRSANRGKSGEFEASREDAFRAIELFPWDEATVLLVMCFIRGPFGFVRRLRIFRSLVRSRRILSNQANEVVGLLTCLT